MGRELYRQLNSWSFINSISQISNYYLKTNFPFKVLTIDTTNRCNLSCKHCYYDRNRGEEELKDKEWEKILLTKRSAGYDFVMWTGGEPLLRADLLEIGTKIFSTNVIITNGTFPLKPFPNSSYFVSIDGSPNIHDTIRGRISKVVEKNIKDHSSKLLIATTITQDNLNHLEETYLYWSKISNVQFLHFDFYTPAKKVKDRLVLDDDQYRSTIKKLLTMKEKYGEKIFLSKNTYKRMIDRKGEPTSNCIAKNVISLESNGEIKNHCFMGENADCTKCGKFIPYAFYSIFHDMDLSMLNNICRVI